MIEQVKRGAWLTGFLILALVASIGGLTTYVVMWKTLASMLPAWLLYSLVGISVLRSFSVLAIWFWSKSGVAAYIALSLVAMALQVAFGQLSSLLGIGGVIIIVALVWRKWKYMSWGVSSAPRSSDAS